MRYKIVALLVVLILAMAAPVYAHTGDRGREQVSIEIVSESGSSYLNIPHEDLFKGGTHIIKKYLEARKGENYGIVIRNMTPGRIGVVIAVDGRNIISGRKSDLNNSEEMYIVGGYEHTRYDGWRKDRDTIHKFYFTEPADSYSVRTFSDSSAMGVIAVAVYREKEHPRMFQRNSRSEGAPQAPAAESASRSKSGLAKDESAGTGFGEEHYSPTIKVVFEPEDRPLQTTLIKYEWREVLCRKGIVQCRHEKVNRLWDNDNYAPYPPGYLDR
jgi:hypothetical protein